MFFYDTAELQKYVDLNISFDMELMKPKLMRVDRDILELFFGADFIEDLQGIYDTAINGDISPFPAPVRRAIEKMREISAPIAAGLWVTPGQLQVDNTGVYIVRNENRATAFEWQIVALINSYMKIGYQAIESAIRFFDKHIADYPLYASYEEYGYFKACWIPDSRVFTRLYSPLNNSFWSFVAMRSCMDKADQQDIRNVLLPKYYRAIKTRLAAGTLTAYDEELLPMIRQAVANLTVARAINELSLRFDENGFVEFDNTTSNKTGSSVKTAKGEPVTRSSNSLFTSGRENIAEIKAHLEAYKVNYPDYTSDPAYIADQPATVTNSTDQNYYNAL